MKVFVPCDQYQAKAIVKAVADIDGPCYVRLGRGAVEDVYDENYKFELGKGKVLIEGHKIALVATGMMVQEALKAADILAKEDISVTVVDMPCIKPIDEELIEEIAKLPAIHVEGLMTIAPYVEDPEENRPVFRKLKELSVDIAAKNINNVRMAILSMGMTGDYEVAVEEGATLVRVGTGVFGERDYSKR